MRVLPAMDLRGGACVRLLQGDFGRETRYDVDPEDLVQRYVDLGATWIHVVDLDGARDGSPHNRSIIDKLARRRDVKFQVGGGIRSEESFRDLLARGVARCVVGSKAVSDPDLIARLVPECGADTLVVALDVRIDQAGLPVVVVSGWQAESSLSLWEAAERFLASGVRHVLCTDVDRDGAMRGPNLDLYTEAMDRFPAIAWQASGGVRHVDDLCSLSELRLSAAVVGKALLENRISKEELSPFLRAE